MEVKFQDTLEKMVYISPDSWYKRLDMQPLSGQNTITVGSNQIETRIELPADVLNHHMTEIGYNLSLNLPAVGVPGGSFPLNATTFILLPAKYVSEFLRTEVYESSSVLRFVDIVNADKYSKMSTLLYNNHRERTVNQRFCFKSARGSISSQDEYPIQQSLTLSDITFTVSSDSFLESLANLTPATNSAVNGGSLPDCIDGPQNWIVLGYVTVGAANVTASVTYNYNFNYKLSDMFHDSWLAQNQDTYLKGNMVHKFTWNPVAQILASCTGTLAGAAGGRGFSATSSILQTLGTGVTLNVQNIYLRYYVQQNPDLRNKLMESSYDLIWPYIYQNNISNTGNNVSLNLFIGDEAPNKFYKLYSALFANQFANTAAGATASQQNGWIAQNCTNIHNQKWSLFELYLNGDRTCRFDQYNYDDLSQYMLDRFSSGSLVSKRYFEDLGTVVYVYDSDKDAGKKCEYNKERCLAGLTLNKQYNINPRFLNLGTSGTSGYVGGTNLTPINPTMIGGEATPVFTSYNATNNYTLQAFAVVLRKARIDRGQLIIPQQ